MQSGSRAVTSCGPEVEEEGPAPDLKMAVKGHNKGKKTPLAEAAEKSQKKEIRMNQRGRYAYGRMVYD